MTELRNWYLVVDTEISEQCFCIIGEVYNDETHKRDDGEKIITCEVINIIDGIATTKNGGIYKLGLYDGKEKIQNGFRNLKKGDQILINTNADLPDRIVTVEKITPTGLIKGGGMTFYPTGKQQGKCNPQWFIQVSNVSENRGPLIEWK